MRSSGVRPAICVSNTARGTPRALGQRPQACEAAAEIGGCGADGCRRSSGDGRRRRIRRSSPDRARGARRLACRRRRTASADRSPARSWTGSAPVRHHVATNAGLARPAASASHEHTGNRHLPLCLLDLAFASVVVYRCPFCSAIWSARFRMRFPMRQIYLKAGSQTALEAQVLEKAVFEKPATFRDSGALASNLATPRQNAAGPIAVPE